MPDPKKSLEERLKNHPHLRARVEAMLDIAENATGDIEKANDAEERIIEEMRQTGKEILVDWAQEQQRTKADGFLKVKGKDDKIKNHTKKNFGGTRPSEK
jgi:hypothetical protein